MSTCPAPANLAEIATLPFTPEQHGALVHPAATRGTVVIAWKEGAEKRWRQLPVDVRDLPEALKGLAGRYDHYISQARFLGRRRVAQNAFGISAMFADLDFYKRPHLAEKHPLDVLDLVLAALEEAGQPEPSLAMTTGRGLALWWLHDPIPRAALHRWNPCQEALHEVLDQFGVDWGARDVTRVLRLAGTHNSANGRLVEPIYASGEPRTFDQLAAQILPSRRAEIHELQIQRALRRQQTEPRLWTPPNTLTAGSLWDSRLADLQQLRRELRWFGALPPGHRDKWLFVAACGAAWLTTSLQGLRREIVALAREATAGTWTERATLRDMGAVITRTEQALRGELLTHDGREIDPRYRLTNEWIIRELGITTAEQRELRTLISREVKQERQNERRDAARRAADRLTRDEYQEQAAARRAQTYQLADAGHTPGAIAARVGYSLTHVRRLLAQRTETEPKTTGFATIQRAQLVPGLLLEVRSGE